MFWNVFCLIILFSSTERQRSEKVTRLQKEVYVAFLEHSLEMRLRKHSDASIQDLWIDLTEKLNSVKGPKKSVEEWKKVKTFPSSFAQSFDWIIFLGFRQLALRDVQEKKEQHDSAAKDGRWAIRSSGAHRPRGACAIVLGRGSHNKWTPGCPRPWCNKKSTSFYYGNWNQSNLW